MQGHNLEEVVQTFGTAAEEQALLDSLDPDAADDRLDALLACGWQLRLGRRSYDLVPPSRPVAPVGGARRST